jgi:coniferyl-aldehyde dehydrogenase
MSQVATPAPAASPSDPQALVRAPFDRLKAAWRAGTPPTLGERTAMLEAMARWTLEHQEDIARAIDADFGGRSHHETRMAEVWMVIAGIRHAQKHLRRWMRPEGRSVFWVFLPATARVVPEPLGVVGIIAPWNYPFQLAFAPLTAAVAAGNKVLLKPSELTPRTSALLAEGIEAIFPADHVAVVQGAAEVGAAFSSLPFDHLFFTGSTRVGRLVMRAAADNLTPVTLELGGKSPVIVHEGFDVKRAAERITAGKWLNAGQTCIAPDYVLVHHDRRDALVEALRGAVGKAYPTIADNPDYTAIVSDQHLARLNHLVDDAESRGARAVWLHPEGAQAGGKLPPVALVDVNEEMEVMQEEIFGPVLPLVGVGSTEEAVSFVQDRPHPLALYVFDDDRRRADAVLDRLPAGGCVVNDTLLHIANEELPFGGVGESGMGAYHGEAGFRTFSHLKPIFYQARLNGAGITSPPYGKAVERLLDLLVR